MATDRQPMCDNDLLRLLAEHDGRTVADIAEHFHVTYTAIRNRLTRLMQSQAVSRKLKFVQSRGRPQHLYYITSSGKKAKKLLDESRSRDRVADSQFRGEQPK